MAIPAGRVIAQAAVPRTPMPFTRLTGPVVMDGFSNEPAWTSVPAVPLTMYLPRSGGTPVNHGDVRFAYDDQNILIAARLYASSRDRINGFSLYRDRATEADDYFRVLFDSFDDREHGLVFGTTPTGIRIDYAVARDGAETNYDWNGRWDVATAVTDSGWFVEMRIPLSTLRYRRADDGIVVMGVTVARFCSRDHETDSYPVLSGAFSNATLRPSLARRISLATDRGAAKEIIVSPYTTVGAGTDSRRVPGVTTSAIRVGGDVKASISSNLTLDLTANPDFAEAEADDHQLNLTRFPLFVPEKRPFFQERAGVFTVNTGADDASRVFNTRNIGLTPDGQTVPIRGGLRSVGRFGAWDVAALAVQTDPASASGGTYAVVRFRREIDDAGSTIGGIVTSQTDRSYRNQTYAVDATWRPGRNEFATLQSAQSSDSHLGWGLATTMLRGSWERRAFDGLGYSAIAKWTGPNFLPALGFEPRPDMTQFVGALYYGWTSDRPRFWQQIKSGVEAEEHHLNQAFALDSRVDNAYTVLTFSSGAEATLELERPVDVLTDTLHISSDVFVPPGRYTTGSLIAQYTTAPSRRARGTVTMTTGTLYDARQVVVSLAPTLTVSRNLELGAELERRAAHFETRNQHLDGDILRLRLDAAANTRLSANFYTQYSRADRIVLFNGRVRLNSGEGNDVYLVYRESNDLESASFFAPRAARQRRLLLKAVRRLGQS